MACKSRWARDQRAQLLKMVHAGISEQEIRNQFTTNDNKGRSRAMTAVEFAQQLKQAMVEAGEIKQTSREKKAKKQVYYEVTQTGRLTISDFEKVTGAEPGSKFVLEKPRGRSKAWRIMPA
jgi:predicted transcriptional regulator